MGQAIADDAGLEACGLTFGELEELWLGPSPQTGSLFNSEDDLRAAWQAGRDVVMRLWAKNGRRPQIWWHLVAPELGLEFPGYDRQQRYLFEAGVLEEPEALELLQTWRRDFDRGEIDHIPRALVREWRKTKRRARKKEPRELAGLGSA